MSVDAESLRRTLKAAARESELLGEATDKQLGYLNGLLSSALGRGEAADVGRHQLFEFLFGKRSSKRLTKAEASVLIDWLVNSPEPGAEAHRILDAWGLEHGQLELGI